jgi:hypothetical protein
LMKARTSARKAFSSGEKSRFMACSLGRFFYAVSGVAPTIAAGRDDGKMTLT